MVELDRGRPGSMNGIDSHCIGKGQRKGAHLCEVRLDCGKSAPRVQTSISNSGQEHPAEPAGKSMTELIRNLKRIDHIDALITRVMGRVGPILLTYSIAVIFIWFQNSY